MPATRSFVRGSTNLLESDTRVGVIPPQIVDQPHLGTFENDGDLGQVQGAHLLLELTTIRSPLDTTRTLFLQQFVRLGFVLIVTCVVGVAPHLGMQIPCPVFLLSNTLRRNDWENSSKLDWCSNANRNFAPKPLMNVNIWVTSFIGEQLNDSGKQASRSRLHRRLGRGEHEEQLLT